ncbi:NAD(P)/FAD-dependent oxidoreductase [Streptomyces liangshanensis]|uniref:NAD(P)/FAD-dependent oxidoreductase n=1 Tax=Streptomyces liangshanensis TaxID=2717324 RepID=UPI0036DA4193
MTTSARRVVVVGGGYAGIKLARGLDEIAQVTLIDLKEVFFHRIASLRASTDPAWTHAPFIPYDRLLDRGQVLLNKVVGIRTAEREVVLATGDVLAYDVLVIATGADYQEPARFTGTTVEEAARAFRSHQQRAVRARSALVIGGGPSGVELSAELRRANPAATVTLAHSGPHLLADHHSARPGRRAQAWLEAHDVRVQLNTLVSSAGGGPSRLQDQAGNSVGADLVFWTTGTTPNTLWLRLAGLGGWLTPGGHVKVDDHLRVVGQRDIFAIGDVNDVAEAKVTPSALAQGDAAVHNIQEYFARGSKHGGEARPYRPAPVRIHSVPFGPEAGLTVLPFHGRDTAVLGSRVTVNVKSRNLMLPHVRGLLKSPPHGDLAHEESVHS